MTTIGFFRMGYHSNGDLHGYGKRVLVETEEEGLFEDGEYKDQEEYDQISQYDIKRDEIAKTREWNKYLI